MSESLPDLEQAAMPVECEHHYTSIHEPGHLLYWVRLCAICGQPDWDDLDREIRQLMAKALADAEQRTDKP